MPGKKKTKTESTSFGKSKKPAVAKTSDKTSTKPKKIPVRKSSGINPAQKVIKRTKASQMSDVSGETIRKKTFRRGETQMVAFIRDPQCIFTYWEVTPESIESVKLQLMDEYKDSSMVLRVFKTGPNDETELVQEIRVEPGEMNRYVELKEKAGNYFVEIAQKAPSGRIVVYARSNKIITGISTETPVGSSKTGGGRWETPENFLEYFADVDETDVSATVPRISSAEAYRKDIQRKKLDRYSASRIG